MGLVEYAYKPDSVWPATTSSDVGGEATIHLWSSLPRTSAPRAPAALSPATAPACNAVALRAGKLLASTALHSGKDLAVSLPLSYPYGGTGPSRVGWGPPLPFGEDVSARTSRFATDGRYPLPAEFARVQRDSEFEHPEQERGIILRYAQDTEFRRRSHARERNS